MTDSGSEARALVSLLGDEDEKILAMVWEHLLEMGAEATPFLEEAVEAKDPRLRMRARHLLSRIRLDLVERELHELSHQGEDEFDLERGLSVLARLEYPTLEADQISGPLDEIAAMLKPRLNGVTQPIERIRTINRLLFEELKFIGNPHELYEFESVLLPRVLERRTGIPISLASVYLLVTKRVGLPFRGVGLPNHFLVRHGDGGEELFVDPYLGGKLLTRKDCIQYLTSAGFFYKDSYITEATSREMVIRTLRHLMVIYSKHQNRTHQERLKHFVEILQTRASAR